MKIRFNPRSLCFQAYTNDAWVDVNDGVKFEPTLDELRKIDRYRIEVSLVCNLRCEYCVVHMNNVEQQNTVMSMETAATLVEQFNREVGSIGSVFLMGGEPLLNIDVVKYFIENIEGSAIIFTNALSLDKNLAHYFYEHNVYILTSLDGYTLQQNQKRFGNNPAKYEQIVENIKYAISIGCKVGISCLLHQDNVVDATKIAEYFVNYLHARAMSFSYPHMTVKESLENNFDMMQYAEQQIALYEFAKEKRVYIDQIGKIVGAIAFGFPAIAACKAGLSQRTFYPIPEYVALSNKVFLLLSYCTDVNSLPSASITIFCKRSYSHPCGI